MSERVTSPIPEAYDLGDWSHDVGEWGEPADPPPNIAQTIFDTMFGKGTDSMPDPTTMPACRCRTCRHLRNDREPGAPRDTWLREMCWCDATILAPRLDLDAPHYCRDYENCRRPKR